MFVVFFLTLVTCSAVLGQFQFGLGTTAPPGGKSFDPNCTDKMNSCWQMLESNCRAPYEDWAKQYCPNRCGYCVGPTTPAPPCVNKLTNCQSYDKSVCTNPDYTTWAGENCRYFCRMCSPDELLRLDSITTTIKPEECVDKVDCRQYGTNACSEAFKEWSKDNCANYCGYCQGIPTPPPVCEDKIPNCKAYNPDTCTNPDYNLWVNDNCKKFCGRCPGSGSPSMPNIPPTFAPGHDSPTIPYAPPTPLGPRKRNVLAKRQFEASHHHQGGTHDCWDGTTTDPYCLTQAPDEGTTASSSLENSAGFSGSEFKPHPKPDPDWDSKPSTEAPFTTTEKTKLPVTTEAVPQVTNDTAIPPIATGTATPVRHTITENPDQTAPPSTAAPEITQKISSATDAQQVTLTVSGATDAPQVTQTISGATNSPQVTQTVSGATPSPQVTQTVSGATDSSQVTQTVSGATDSPQINQTVSAATASPSGTQTVTTSASAVQVNATVPDASVSLTTPSPTGPPPFITGSTTVQAPHLLTNSTMKTETSASTVATNAPPSLVTVQSTEINTHMQSGITREHTTHAQTPQHSTATTASSTAASTTASNETCEDTVDNCALYGKQACTEPVYRPWAKAHCSAFCEFCTPVTLTPFVCKDKLANCREFDSGDLCTAESYFAWSRDNCYAYCGFAPCNKATQPTTTRRT